MRDEELERAVKKAFDTPDLKDISIEVKNRVVRLTGTVPSGARRLEAAVAARAVPGVRAVADDLRLGQLDTNRTGSPHLYDAPGRAGWLYRRPTGTRTALLHQQRGAWRRTTTWYDRTRSYTGE